MQLFSPVWMTGEENKAEKAIKAVSKIDDQSDLKEIVLNAPLDKVKLAAITRLTDQNYLKQIALALFAEDKVIRALVDKISDQADLLEISLSGTAKSSGYARQKLDVNHKKQLIISTTDAALAARTIMDGFEDDAFLQTSVISGFREFPCLKEALAHRSNAGETAVTSVFIAALANIHDQDFLYDIVMGNIDGPSKDSIHNSDRDMGAGVYNGWNIFLREAAVWNIHDDNKLYRIVTEGPPAQAVWHAAISRMINEEHLNLLMKQYGTYYNSKGWCAGKQLEGNWDFYSPLKGCPTVGWDKKTPWEIEKQSRRSVLKINRII